MIDKAIDYLRKQLVDPNEFNEYVYAGMQKASFVQAYGGDEQLQVAAAMSDLLVLDDLDPVKLVRDNPWLPVLSMNLILLFNRRQIRPPWTEWADAINNKMRTATASEILIIIADRIEHLKGSTRKLELEIHQVQSTKLVDRTIALISAIREKTDRECGKIKLESALEELELAVTLLKLKINSYQRDHEI